jgi:hypothetical protein
MKTCDYFDKRELLRELIKNNFCIENENKYDNINGPLKLFQFIETKKSCDLME